MRVFFIGTVAFSHKALKACIEAGAEIVGVATRVDTGLNADWADLVPTCEAHGIPYKHVRDINHPNNIAYMAAAQPDIVFCFGWSSLLRAEILRLPPLGVVGYHPAALPMNRGRHPLIWALVLGLPQTASTFFFMDEGADTGDILSQAAIPVEPADDASILYARMEDTAIDQIRTFVPQLASGKYPRIKQDADTGNNWRKRGRMDGQIDFRMSTQSILNLVRALAKPYVGSHLMYNGQDVKVWKAVDGLSAPANLEPGKVLDSREDGVRVKTGDGSVLIQVHEFLTLPQTGEYL